MEVTVGFERKKLTMLNEYVYDVLFNNDNHSYYDFKNEFKSIFHITGNDTNIERWKKYKAYIPANKDDEIDCDVTELAVYIYKTIWKFLNSINRPTKQYNSKPYYIRNHKYQLILNTSGSKEYYRGDTMTSFTTTYKHYLNNQIKYKKSTKEIEKFASLHHTIGNMIPIPSYFNSERSGYGLYDFWDLALQSIKSYYENPNDMLSLSKMLNPTGDNKNLNISIKNCICWLKYFSNWNIFVENNYLQDYMLSSSQLLDTDANGNYIPLLFWTNHSYNNVALPEDESEFYNYINTLNIIIENRNDRILKIIKDNLGF